MNLVELNRCEAFDKHGVTYTRSYFQKGKDILPFCFFFSLQMTLILHDDTMIR